jgi:hypothetical protein
MYKMDVSDADGKWRLLVTECNAWAVGFGRTFTRRSTPRSLMRLSVQPHAERLSASLVNVAPNRWNGRKPPDSRRQKSVSSAL